MVLNILYWYSAQTKDLAFQYHKINLCLILLIKEINYFSSKVKRVLDFYGFGINAKCINKCSLFSAVLRSTIFVKNTVTFL